MAAKTITLKALVDKEKDKIIYVQSKGDFVNVLFTFLTMPLGTITRLTRNHPPISELGCINNLYSSVENLDASYLRTEACKTMLIFPQNAAADHCTNLKVKFDDTDSVRYFFCENISCSRNSMIPLPLVCHYNNATCSCGRPMNREIKFSTPSQSGFVAEVAQFVITDELEVQPSSSIVLFSLLANRGAQDCTSLEERTFEIGADEVLKLLKASWLSSTPLTDVLLQKTTIPQVSYLTYLSSYTSNRIGEHGLVKSKAAKDGSKISVKLLLSKSKRILCYAEVKEDFVDLLFSFLTIPLGHVLREPQGACTKGSFRNLYRSVQYLDAKKSLILQVKKDILLKPKLAAWFGYSDRLLGLEETKNRNYWYGYPRRNSRYPVWCTASSIFTASYFGVDPKVPNGKATKSEKGFVRRRSVFTVTDDLRVSPISQTSGLSILKRLEVQYTDIEERTVLVGKEEALDILVAAFNGSSYPLSQVFLLKGKE